MRSIVAPTKNKFLSPSNHPTHPKNSALNCSYKGPQSSIPGSISHPEASYRMDTFSVYKAAREAINVGLRDILLQYQSSEVDDVAHKIELAGGVDLFIKDWAETIAEDIMRRLEISE